MNFLFSSGFRKLSLVFVVFSIFGGIVLLAWPGTIERLDIIAHNPNPLIRHFAPTWRSLKRITDISYMVVYSFRKTTLPVYELSISKNDKSNLLEILPNFPTERILTEEHKKTVKGIFRSGDYYTDDAKIRYRGVMPNHWNAAKKSWQINLPAEAPLGDQTDIRLFLPEDKEWVIAALNAYRAERFGVITPSISYVRLFVNTMDMGVYLSIEGWEETLLEKHGHPLGPIFSEITPENRSIDLLKPESIGLWENRFDSVTPIEKYDQLAYFLKLIADAPDDMFERELPAIVNMDTFYRWLTISALSGGILRQSNGENQSWYFNQATGKLEPILFDTGLTRTHTALDISNNRLVNRTMKSPQFRKEFNDILRDYINNPQNLIDEIAFYDKTAAMIRPELLSDSKKIQTSREVLKLIREQRETMIHNFETVKSMLAANNEFAFVYSSETYPLAQSTFGTAPFEKIFLAAGASAREFLRENSQFRLRSADTLVLPAGTHTFSHTVIVPRNLKLLIEPGARLIFNPDISFISYSPVESRGTASAPIRMHARFSNLPWGVFAIIGAPGTNTFRYTHIQDGKDMTINGLYFSGSLSVRASDLDFEHGTITRSRADDGIHVLGGKARIAHSTFTDASSDAVDIDFAKGADSVVEKNIFTKGGGDAIDLSFSEITVRENIITGCGDKGISVGEASTPFIEHTTIIGCMYGIAVKDRSFATIIDTILLGNNTGIGLYRKKPHFVKGGNAEIKNTTLWHNETELTSDAYSTVSIQNSAIEGGYAGSGNTDKAPDLNKLIPANLFSYLKTLIK